MGLSLKETLAIPFSLLLDFSAIDQIRNGLAVQVESEEDSFFRLLELK